MDFRPDPELARFREEVRAFFTAELPAEMAHVPHQVVAPPEILRRWQPVLKARGWAAPTWEKQHGGTGWSLEQQLVFEDERARAGGPLQDGFAQKLIGPVLNRFATPEQWRAHVPPILSGERLWCQGFSEPGSGSDLASLRTRAELRGDHYLVNGQKIWTTNAHNADWIFLLARTDTEAKKQAGISFFLIDMKSPGVTVRPILSIDGEHHLNETFFDDVRVPVGNLIGAEGMGWAITKFLLNNEHATTADLPALELYLQQMKMLATHETLDGEKLIDRPEFALRIARFEAELRAIRMMVMRTAAAHGDEGHLSHSLGSMLKLRGTDLQQRMTLFLVELLGERGPVAQPGAQTRSEAIAADMFFRRASTIYGGTSEVQRGIVAKLLFGM